ncbi:hypothetical protein RHGRI_003306 [Rhododendron griersonianum]|nr:hypothetical protein RHGRI_003306 [Rhododendron griersonianum]
MRIQFTDHATFIRDYGQRLGLHANLEWASETDMAIWLDAAVHNSFVRSSTIGILFITSVY